MSFSILGDESGRTFGSLDEAQDAIEADQQEAWRRFQARMRREREVEARRSAELDRQRWQDQRARIETLLAGASEGPQRAQDALRQAVEDGDLENALLAALRIIALPLVFRSGNSALAERTIAGSAHSVDTEGLTTDGMDLGMGHNQPSL